METNKEAAPSQLKIGTASPLLNTLYGYYKLWQKIKGPKRPFILLFILQG